MRANKSFSKLPLEFWANIRTISQEVGYTVKPRRQKGVTGLAGPVKVPTLLEIRNALEGINLSASHLVDARGKATSLGKQVVAYFEYRADCLNRIVEPLLMTGDQACEVFEQVRAATRGGHLISMNKQSGEMKKPAYFTNIINMLIDANLGGAPCNFNPQELTTVTRNRAPFRTLARRIDGAFPGPVDPLAVWEIKEYYYTTTFGSRVADGVYESLLDGMELEELDRALTNLVSPKERPAHIEHLLMVDAYFTWWIKGRSYLCRILDMLHMGYVDEVLFGREVVTELPKIARRWAKLYRDSNMSIL